MERAERRRFIRLEVPIGLQYNVVGSNVIKDVTTKDISCDGMRFTSPDAIPADSLLRLTIQIPKAKNPVHAEGKVVWSHKQANDGGPDNEVGLELIKIEEDNKNTFLKYLCDIISIKQIPAGVPTPQV